ncbi:hypothetical protein ACFWBR_26205 [Streptomyces sp. NPDC060006]|uniref:hypothetical protein n=1 Tax=unclassified Streptomyces TaxID=2593676 RepID=UPI003642679C
MRSKGVRAGEGHDVEKLLDELYTTPPPGFVSRREELAALTKASGQVEDARRIHAARRPTLAAWAANLLLRSRPQECRRFLELGGALREAYQTLDAGGIKELSEQRRHIVSALSRQAGRLAAEGGHQLSDTAQQGVEATLRAVLADEDAADRWATGRLEAALAPPSDFPSPTGAPASPPAAPPRAAPPTRTRDELAERRRLRREQLAQARTSADIADRHLHGRHAEQTDAEAVLAQARDRHDRARQQVSTAEQRLRLAREQLHLAAQEQKAAEKRNREAALAAERAERTAREAAQEVKRLSGPVK